jgi:ferrous iron transport protein A
MNAALQRTLAHLEPGVWARVEQVSLEDAERTWLDAVGLATAQHVMVLRRAPFGGPLHVRVESGGEFALDRVLAEAIELAP